MTALERACRAVLGERGLRIRKALAEARELAARPEPARRRGRKGKPPELRERAVALVQGGSSYVAAAEACDASHESVRAWCRAAGVRAAPAPRRSRPRAGDPRKQQTQARRAAEVALRQRLRAELGYSGIGRRHPGAVVFEVGA